MQITNNPISFKAVNIDINAMRTMSQRMGSENAHALKDSICDKYKNSPVNIFVASVSRRSSRLSAKISCKNLPDVYIEEGILASIFKNPKKFFEVLCNTADGLEVICDRSVKK